MNLFPRVPAGKIDAGVAPQRQVRRLMSEPMRCAIVLISAFAVLAPVHAQDLSKVPGVVISYVQSPERNIFTGNAINETYIGSPSITIMPNGDYIASHDLFGSATSSNTTRVFRSTNKGQSWTQQSTVSPAYWSTVFQHNGDLYLRGFRGPEGGSDLLIRKSANNGSTWTSPTSSTTGLLLSGTYRGTPNTPAIHDGRIWFAEHGRSAHSAPVGADLLLASSWTYAPPVAGLGGTDFNLGSEAQIVASPQTGVIVLPRVNDFPNTILHPVNPADPSKMLKPADNGWVELPGGTKKFGAQYDPVAGMFYILSNPVLAVHKGVTTDTLTRTTGALLASRDLLHWDVKKLFLFTPNIDNGTYGEGFQYFNFAMDGNDMAVVSRTAFDTEGDGSMSGENVPERGHDSNLLTFHTIKDFRTVTPAQVLVADSGNNQVLRYEATQTNKLAPLGKFTQGTTFAGAALNAPWGLAQNAKGEVFISERATGGRVLKFDASGNFLKVLATSGADFTGTPDSLAVGPDGFLFLSVAGGTGSSKIYKMDADFGSPSVFIDTTFSGGSFSSPRGIAFASDGNLYVADRGADKIRKFNGSTGAFLSDVTVNQRMPQALTWDPTGARLLFSRRTTDTDDDIASLTLAGAFQTLYTPTDIGQCFGVTSLDGRVFWSDYDNNRIYVLTSQDNKVNSITSGLNDPATMLAITQPPNGERSWTKASSGTWLDLENWYYWGRPDTAEEIAVFGTATGSATTVTLDTDHTLRGLSFRSANKYVLSGTGQISLFPNIVETLVSWDAIGLTSSNPNTQPNPWSASVSDTTGLVTVAPNVTLQTGLSYGGGISVAGLVNSWGGTGFNQNDLNAAISNGEYFHFTIAPASGYALSLKDLAMNIRLVDTQWNGGYVRYQWQYQIGGGAYVTIGEPGEFTGTWSTSGNTIPPLDLAGIAGLQNVSDSISLRLVVWRVTGSGNFQVTFGRLTGRDLVVNGTVSPVSNLAAGNSVIDVQQGNHDIELPVVLEAVTEATTGESAKLHFRGLLDLNGNTLSMKGPGNLYFDNSFIMNGGRVITDGEAPVSFTAESSTTLDGTLEFQPGNAGDLVEGARFNILNGLAYIDGTFSSVVLPSLPTGLKWDTSTLYTNGEIEVVEDPAVLPPGAPSGLSASYAAPNINLSWSAVASATSYTVRRSTTSGGSYTTIANGITATNYTDPSPAAGTYYYVVAGVNDNGTGANSNEDSATVPVPPPAAPQNLSATPAGSQVSLTWSAVSGAVNYRVERSTTSGGPYTTIATGVTTTNYTDSDLAPGTYFYVVSAVNGSGTSDPSNQATASITPPAPSPPANLTAQAGDGKITLNWQAVVGAESYTVKVGLSNGGPYVTQSSDVTETSYIDSNLANGTTYYYVVAAVNQGGSSPNSNQASATPVAPPVPAAAVSRKAHSGMGSFDVPVAIAAGTTAPAGSPPVEGRLSSIMTVVVAFDKNVTSGQATIGSGAATIDGVPSFQGNQMTINLTGVADAQTLRIDLADIQSADGGHLDDAVVTLRLLLGDVNGDGIVSTSDVNLARAATGAALSTQNFRRDVKPDGVISTSDINTIRAATGNSLP